MIDFSADGIPALLKAAKRWAPWTAKWNVRRAKYDKTGHSTGVLYCSAQCAKAQAERNRRARLRADSGVAAATRARASEAARNTDA